MIVLLCYIDVVLFVLELKLVRVPLEVRWYITDNWTLTKKDLLLICSHLIMVRPILQSYS